MVNGQLIESVGTLADCPSHDPTADFLDHDAVLSARPASQRLDVAIDPQGLTGNVATGRRQR